jgi:hypothetical protein
MGKKKEILKNLKEATALLYLIKKDMSFGEVRRLILNIDYSINKAAMIVRDGKSKQTSDSGLNLCGVRHSTDAEFCCTVSTKEMPMTNMFKTTIEVESKAFANMDFTKELMTLLAKYCA